MIRIAGSGDRGLTVCNSRPLKIASDATALDRLCAASDFGIEAQILVVNLGDHIVACQLLTTIH